MLTDPRTDQMLQLLKESVFLFRDTRYIYIVHVGKRIIGNDNSPKEEIPVEGIVYDLEARQKTRKRRERGEKDDSRRRKHRMRPLRVRLGQNKSRHLIVNATGRRFKSRLSVTNDNVKTKELETDSLKYRQDDLLKNRAQLKVKTISV